jgi:hypothetical protein
VILIAMILAPAGTAAAVLPSGLTIGGGPFRVRPQRIDYTGDGIGVLGKLIPGQKHTV